MVRIFRHYVSGSLLLLGIVENLFLMLSIYGALFLRWADSSDIPAAIIKHIPEAIAFSSVFSLSMFALGLYNRRHVRDLGKVSSWLLVSFVLGSLIMVLLFYIYPQLFIWRSAFALAFVFGFCGIMFFRWLLYQVADTGALDRRILVLGVGRKAARIDALERTDASGFSCVGFVPLSDKELRIDENRPVWGNLGLPRLAVEEGIEEIVVAVDERRGAMPVQALLNCKLAGITVTDYSTFWERETSRVDLDALQPGWLIFSDGFVGGWGQQAGKRIFDVVASLLLLAFSLPVLVLTAIAIRLESAGPVFYRQERVGLNGKPFMLLKFRSMRTDAEHEGQPQWASVNDSRVTRVGAIIRKIRVDEIPQVFNILSGHMSLIGPRPERPFFVEKLRELIPYYFERHRVKPGLSGWAQLNYPYGASTEDAKEKFQYDLYYIKNYSMFLDFIVLIQTARVVLWPIGAR